MSMLLLMLILMLPPGPKFGKHKFIILMTYREHILKTCGFISLAYERVIFSCEEALPGPFVGISGVKI